MDMLIRSLAGRAKVAEPGPRLYCLCIVCVGVCIGVCLRMRSKTVFNDGVGPGSTGKPK